MRRSLVGLLVLAAVVLLVKHTRWYVFPKRFQQVEAGVFRSGQLERGPYERVVKTYGIKSVLRLNELEEGDPLGEVEAGIVRGNGLEFREIPMVGDGFASWDDYDRAADFIADASHLPVLFHCSAGEMRSGAVHAVYRMRHSEWTWEQAAEELARFGPDQASNPKLHDFLKRYYVERELPRRAASEAPLPQ